ncbi:hypothetical protein GCM10022630_18720 [Thermobifida alba]
MKAKWTAMAASARSVWATVVDLPAAAVRSAGWPTGFGGRRGVGAGAARQRPRPGGAVRRAGQAVSGRAVGGIAVGRPVSPVR